MLLVGIDVGCMIRLPTKIKLDPVNIMNNCIYISLPIYYEKFLNPSILTELKSLLTDP